MIHIAIVEDDKQDYQRIESCLVRYSKEHQDAFDFTHYDNAFDFLEAKKSFDLIFLDIMLPQMTGMEAAKKLRALKNDTLVIFVTSMAQFAITSYEVDAFDFIVKPVSYERLTLKLNKALNVIRKSQGKTLFLSTGNDIVQISSEDIYYIEVRGHRLSYHTKDNDYQVSGSLNKVEEVLKDKDFMRCNSCYLINPNYVKEIYGYSLLMANGDELKISQPRKKSFIDEFTNWMGQGK